VEGCAAPHLSHIELIEKHAKLKTTAGTSAPPTLRQKLKGLFTRSS
jgi:hypothetical protein